MGVGGGGGGGVGAGVGVGGGGDGGVGAGVGGGGGGSGASAAESESVSSVPSEAELISLTGSSDGSLTRSSDWHEPANRQHATIAEMLLHNFAMFILISFYFLRIFTIHLGQTWMFVGPTFTFPTLYRGRPEHINDSIHKLKPASGKFVFPDTGQFFIIRSNMIPNLF